jgi:DNA-binding XRE family transcriptional regulator
VTGNDLKEARLERGWTQRELARRAGLTHKAVQYWEAKARIDPFAHAVKAIAMAHGQPVGEYRDGNARARDGVLSFGEADRLLGMYTPGMSKRPYKRVAHRRVTCAARTRKGTPCRAKSEPGRRRCKFHGGMSTGPRTAEGRARIAEAQRRRWARQR